MNQKPTCRFTHLIAAVVVAGLCLTATTAPLVGQEETAPAPTESVDLSVQVFEIFVKSCIGCHGSHMAKPKGKYVMDDFKAMAADEDYIVPGDPEDSYCFETMIMAPDDPEFMPPPDSEYPMPTKEEIDLVRQWIMQGAKVSEAAANLPNPFIEDKTPQDNGDETQTPDPDPNGEVKPLPDVNDTPPDQSATPPDQVETPTAPKPVKAAPSVGKQWRMFFGQFHSASTHMPIGLIVAALLAEMLAMLNRNEKLRYVARFCLVFGTLGAIYTFLSGWWVGEAEGYRYVNIDDYPGMLFFAKERGMDVYWHRWLGALSVILSVVTTLFAFAAEYLGHRREDGRKGVVLSYRAMLLATVVIISIVGLLGGNIVSGNENIKKGHRWHYHWISSTEK